MILALCLSLVHPALAAETRHDIGTGDLILDGRSCANGCTGHRVTGSTNANRIVIRGGRHTIVLDGVSIENRKIPLEISNGAVVELELKGSNWLSAPDGTAFLIKGAAATVRGNGSLVATAEAAAAAAAKGSGSSGATAEAVKETTTETADGKRTITITMKSGAASGIALSVGNSTTAGGETGAYGGNRSGIAINEGGLTIAGGEIEANGGEKGTGICGDDMDLSITGGEVHALGGSGAGIGLGVVPPARERIGRIRISGGHVTAESRHNSGIGCDASFSNKNMTLIIDGGTVEAKGTYGLGGPAEGKMAPAVCTTENRIYIDNATVTAEGTYRGMEAGYIQLTNHAHVETFNTSSQIVSPLRTLRLGVYDSDLKVYSENEEVATGIELLVSQYENHEDTEEELRSYGKKLIETVWGDDPDLSASLVAVNSTLDIDGDITREESRYGATLQFWDSTVKAGAIGLAEVYPDPLFPRIGIHGGEVTSRGGIIGDVTIYDGTVDSTGSYMGIGPHVTIFDGEVTSQGGYTSNGGGVGLGGVRIEDGHVIRNGKWVHADIFWPGRVVICGGKVTALGGFEGSYAWAGGGPGIGGCGDTDGGYVAIYGGEVLAKGSMGPDQSPEAREEMSHWSNLNAWGEVACNAAGIGGASEKDGGEIYIAGGTVTAVGGSLAAGIGGGGSKGNGGQIVISGGEVTSYGGRSAAAIGGGWASLKPDAGRTGEVYITGGNVTAIGYEGTGVGIGNGRTSKPSDSVSSRIVITGGSVKATGGEWSAGIGGTGGSNYGLADRSGYDDPNDPLSWGGSDGGEILIGGDAYVEATGGSGAWGIGGGIPDDSSSNWNPGGAPELTILEGAEVKATKQCAPSTRGSIPDIPQVPDAPKPDEGNKPEPEELPEETEALPFEDVSPYAWYADAVKYALENELFNGTDAARFSPDSPMTRAMLVTVLHRAEGKPTPQGTTSFEDVPQGQWYTDAVLWAAEGKIVNGRGNGLFDPQQDITRQELAVVLYNKAGLPKDKAGSLFGYTDRDKIPKWARDAVGWMTKNGLWVYQDQKELKGEQKATRAEVAAVLQAILEN